MSTRRTFLLQTAAAGALIGAGARTSLGADSALTTYTIPNTDLSVSRIGYGATSLVGWDRNPVNREEIATASTLVHTAAEQGITLFDHADLYGFGKSEAVFGEVLKQSPGLRENIVIQSKCGQVFPPGFQWGSPIEVNLSPEHIVSAVEGSLTRLGTDYLDILLLHAVDALAKPQEIAQAFDSLHRSGKVRYFGVSNYNADQIALLKKDVAQPLVVNQIHISLAHPDAITDGMAFTLQLARGESGEREGPGAVRGGTLDYCRLNDIQVQAWSPMRGVLNPPADAPEPIRRVAPLLGEIAARRQTTAPVVALAWLLNHSAGIVPIIGGSKPEYIVENCGADELQLSRAEWYELFAAAAA